MKPKKGKCLFILLLAIVLNGLEAQSTLNVKEKSGKKTTFVLSDITKLIFSGGNMTINRKDGNNSGYSIINVRNLNFVTITSNDEVKVIGTSNMLLYPNPVEDRLQLRYESVTAEDIYIQIIDTQGKVKYQQNLRSQPGNNNTLISVEYFQKGIYLCRFQQGNNINIQKFIKY